MKRKKVIEVFFFIFLTFATLFYTTNGAPTSKPSHHDTNVSSNNATHHDSHKGIHVFVEMFEHVSTPFIVCCWILLASIAKVVFHHFENLSAAIPESCLLILLGIPVGFILQSAQVTTHLFLTSNLFFQYLLPPIIFDAGYFINTTTFFNNIGTILLYAIVGTIFNTFCVGACVYGVAGSVGVTISLLHSFLFGSLISAVDPVAVLTVFEEVQVNEVLYMLVFGESVLNDAASVVLYRTFENLPTNVDAKQVGLAIASFLVVSIFGTMIGILFGLVASFMTRFTDHVRVIEPIFVFIMAYMAYLTAEIFHFSGIMSILFCGVVMKPYVESNVSRKSHITIKYFLKLLSSSCEAVIFMFLGIALVQYSHVFNLKLVILVIVFISLFRAIGTVSLTYLANKLGRLEKINKVEQFIMCYGGLRGAVAFCLAIIINVGDERLKDTLVTTTLAVIIFTCFVQGGTIKMFVEKLNIERADGRDLTMAEHLNERVMSHVVAGVEEILGIHGHGYWRNIADIINRKYLRPCLTRNPDEYLDDDLFVEKRKLDYKEGISERGDMSVMGSEMGSVMGDTDYMRRLSCDSMVQHGNGYLPGALPAYDNKVYDSNPPPGYEELKINPAIVGFADAFLGDLSEKEKFSASKRIANMFTFKEPQNVPKSPKSPKTPSINPALIGFADQFLEGISQSEKFNAAAGAKRISKIFSSKDEEPRRSRVQRYVDSTPEIDPREYLMQYIPDAKKIKSRSRYSDASVGLHGGLWDESTGHKKKRDNYGRRIPDHIRRSHRHGHRHHHHHHHHHRDKEYTHRHHNGGERRHSNHRHHGDHHHNGSGSRSHGRSSTQNYRSKEPLTSTIAEDTEPESINLEMSDINDKENDTFYENEAYTDEENLYIENEVKLPNEDGKEEISKNENSSSEPQLAPWMKTVDEDPVTSVHLTQNNSVPEIHLYVGEDDESSSGKDKRKKEKRKKKKESKRKRKAEGTYEEDFIPSLPDSSENTEDIPLSQNRRLSERDIQEIIEQSQRRTSIPLGQETIELNLSPSILSVPDRYYGSGISDNETDFESPRRRHSRPSSRSGSRQHSRSTTPSGSFRKSSREPEKTSNTIEMSSPWGGDRNDDMDPAVPMKMSIAVPHDIV